MKELFVIKRFNAETELWFYLNKNHDRFSMGNIIFARQFNTYGEAQKFIVDYNLDHGQMGDIYEIEKIFVKGYH